MKTPTEKAEQTKVPPKAPVAATAKAAPPTPEGRPGADEAPAGDPPPVAAPAYVTQEQFAESQRQLRETLLDGMREIATASRPAPEAPRPNAPAAIDDPTEEEFAAAYETGDARQIAAVQRRALKAAEERAFRRAGARIDEVDNKVNIGMDAVADTASHVGAQGLKHYTRFKKEIDAALSQVPAEARLKSSTLKYVHDMIVGQNYEALEREAIEAARRQDSEPAPVATPQARQQQDGDDNVPTFEQVVGRGAAYWRSQGVDGDEFARRRGYADWKDYVSNPKSSRALRKERAAAGGAGRTMH